MTMTVVYENIGGMLMYENRGGKEHDYVSDTLGSLAATVDPTGAVDCRIEYWPYGEEVNATGTNPSPWSFVGLLGYFRDLTSILLYVRARHYTPNQAQWLTRDPLWPYAGSYSYGFDLPNIFTDSEGKSPAQLTFQQKGSPTSKPWDKSSCSAAGKAALAVLSTCFDKDTAQQLANIMQCLAYGESDCNAGAGSGGNFGLYQLDCTQYNACAPKGCSRCGKGGPPKGCDIFDVGCTSNATVAYIIWLFEALGGSSLGGSLCKNFGVLPCPPKRGNPQNDKTMKCLKDKNIDIFKLPIPKASPNCRRCSSSPTHK